MATWILNNFLWNEQFFLPMGYTWKDIKDPAGAGDLIYPILIGVALIFGRKFMERNVLEKLGLSLGLPAKNKNGARQSVSAGYNEELERRFASILEKGQNPGHKFVEGVAKDVGLELRQVQRWLRRRNNQNRLTRMDKFCESGWRFVCYSSLSLFGCFVTVNKSWFWNTTNCWTDFANQGVDNDIWWYYTVSTGFYWSLFITQFVDVKRKDFWIMFTHHVVTITLLNFSRMASFTRIGSLVLVLHDTADGPLEFAKMANYARRFKLCDFVFSVFVILWIVTRICIYPLHLLRSTLFELVGEIGVWPAYYFFNAMLCSLFVMHIVWTVYIVKVAMKAVFKKEQYKDSRSCSEDDDDDTEDDNDDYSDAVTKSD